MFNFLKMFARDSSVDAADITAPTLEPEKRSSPAIASRERAHKLYAERFAAAKTDRLNTRLFGATLSADEKLRRDLEKIRAASRTAGEDVGYVKRYLGMVQTHIVGDQGFRLQSEAKKANGDLDTDANTAIENAYKEFSEIGVCEISGRMGMAAADQLIVKTVAQDGDILIRHIDGAPNKFGYAFQVIEADLLDAQLYKKLENGHQIKMGVEVDGYGRHVAYHVLTSHPGEHTWTHGNRRYQRIPADQIILPFPMWRPGQNRGVPWAHAALLDMHDIYGYREATLVSARTGAANMLIYERDPDQSPPDDGDGEWSDQGEFVHELEPGASSITPAGYKARESQFNMPDEGVGEFQKASLRGSSSGLEVNYNTLGNDYEGVNFSTIRQAALEDREVWKRLQGWYISQVKQTVRKRWLRNALVMGAIEGLEPYDLKRVDVASFRGRRWQWIDPLKDEQAVGEAMGNFTINPMEVLNDKGVDLEQMGQGWTRFLDIMQPHIERAHKIGLTKNKSLAGKPPPDNENENENEKEKVDNKDD